MTRRLLLLVAIAVATFAASTAALGAEGRPLITEAVSGGFPARSFVLTLPHGMKLQPDTVHISENGKSVNSPLVVPVGESKQKQFGVVLVIDASTSMEGEPEKAAFSAARAFAGQRKGHEQLGVITYNIEPTVVLPFTTDQAQVDKALSKQPPFLFGTHIYDAVVRSIRLLGDSHISVGTIVVLSDGQEHTAPGDTGPHETLASAAAAARGAHVRVFAVGLRSRVSKLGALKKLARDTGGRYVETKSIGQLRAIYTQLGSTLASEYLLRYRSLAGPDRHITVTVSVDGVNGVATSQYQTPALAVATRVPKPPYQRRVFDRVWESRLTMTLVALIVAGLIGLGAMSILSGPRRGTIRKRMAEFVSVPAAVSETSRRPTAQLTEKMLEGTETMLRGSSRWQKFKWELEIAKITMPPEQILVLTAVGSLLVLLFAKVIIGSLLVGVVLAVGIPIGVRSLLQKKLAHQRKLFAEQLPDNLQVLASALRAGHSFIGALSVVVNDAPQPAKSEFQRVVADEQLGVPIDDALHVVVERMQSRELEQVALVAALQRETGGNTAEVLDQVTDTIRERFELRRTVQTLTAQGRMSRWVLTFLPLFLLLAITLINPGYMGVMYHSTTGQVLLVLAAISVVSGSFVIKRIVNIKV
jgi:tight adherence protein B